MPKLGRPFQQVVADVVSELDPDATVEEGQWVEGPDGRRDMDVHIRGTVDGVPRSVLIECKDYNPASGRVGIGIVDALDSKRHDLGADVTLLCSNAGFAEPAIRKARRKGIGLIGVLRKDDPRIRYRVVDEIYIRRFDFLSRENSIKIWWLGNMKPRGNVSVDQIVYDDRPIENWLLNRIAVYVGSNPVVNGVHSLTLRFKHPVVFRTPAEDVAITKFRIEFEISGGWFAQQIEIDATSGLYDWLRRTIRFGPGEGRVIYRDVKFGEGGTPIICPPELDRVRPKDLQPGELTLSLADIGRIKFPKPEEIPDLDGFVVDEDLAIDCKNLPDGSWLSA